MSISSILDAAILDCDPTSPDDREAALLRAYDLAAQAVVHCLMLARGDEGRTDAWKYINMRIIKNSETIFRYEMRTGEHYSQIRACIPK